MSAETCNFFVPTATTVFEKYFTSYNSFIQFCHNKTDEWSEEVLLSLSLSSAFEKSKFVEALGIIV